MARNEVKGLDTLRFVAAGTVALGHGAALPISAWLGGDGLARVFKGAYDCSFDGLAAVLVFFVISGFCIHYGPASGAPCRPASFWVRRGVRILGPMLAALAIGAALGPAAQGALKAVIWSIYCELIYYALYPALRIAFRRFGLGRVIMASCVLSLLLIAAGWRLSYYWSYGIGLTWLVAAPAWLAGCLMAERMAAGKLSGPASHLGGVRLATWAYGALALAVFFHAPVRVGFPALLFPFQALAYVWVVSEAKHFAQHPPSPALEWCGRWSYSLYLVHNMVIAVTPISPSAVVATWALRVALIVAGSLAFHFLVEAPSHWLARRASRYVDGWLQRAGPATREPVDVRVSTD